jgi:uncharacterized protein YkwD
MRWAGFIASPLLVAGAAYADPVATRALNDFRATAGLGALAYSEALEEAARAHAEDMASHGFFSHTGSDGSTVSQRVSRTGYGWCVAAENIAMGQGGLAEVIAAWAGSPGHRANMLSRDVGEFAMVEAPGRIWVMVLAAPGC